ncbi:MAG: hypothetical protein A3J88_05380, partial [Melioribacter sp. RIFOXYB12_FULL_38_5]
MRILTVFINIIILIFMTSGCNAQKEQPKEKKNRKAAFAGQFYPAGADELKRDLKEYFALSIVKPDGKTMAVISPHAGYVFSGQVAANAFSAINPDKSFKRIFVITSSHRISFEGASVYCDGNYETPLGEVEVDTAFASQLCHESDVFTNRTDAHISEHSLEVQLPFLQHHLKTPIKIVPIIIGTQNTETCKKIAKILKPYFCEENLFVISTDFSHYPEYNAAIDADKTVATSLVFNDPKRFRDSLSMVESKGSSGLVTGMCGWASVITLLYITEGNPDIKYHLLEYRNSGDSKYGDKKKVVGYWSLKVTGKNETTPTPNITDEDKKKLLSIARKTIEEFIINGKTPEAECKSASDILKSQMGAFVTLHKKGALRGCIGQFKPSIPLCELISELAISSSTRDYRFSAVSKSELTEIDIEISVLTPMQKISDVSKIELGKHGIYIVKGSKAGTFLPQVATETGWTLEEFLGHCSRDKAGIGWD